MEEIKEEILASAKLMLEIEDAKSDELLTLLIDDSISETLSYCGLETLPKQLTGFIPILAARKYSEIKNGGVKSIAEGDRRIEYADSGFRDEYEKRLKPFVNRQGKVPTDLESDKNDKSL